MKARVQQGGEQCFSHRETHVQRPGAHQASSSAVLAYKAQVLGSAGTASPSAGLPGCSDSCLDSFCLRTWISLRVCILMLAASWSILSQFVWHQEEVPQYYSEQLTFSIQPRISAVSLSNKRLGSSPAHFSRPRAACW